MVGALRRSSFFWLFRWFRQRSNRRRDKKKSKSARAAVRGGRRVDAVGHAQEKSKRGINALPNDDEQSKVLHNS